LQEHLFSDPNRPESICFHFRNQYRHWVPEWGFSIPHNVRMAMSDNIKYKVDIESSIDNNKPMLQSDFSHQGDSNTTYLFIGHFDHPEQVNDGLSGCIVAYEIIKRLQGRKTRFSYRAFASVEIVGSVYYLDSKYIDPNELKEAVFLAFSGIQSPLAYQYSYKKESLLDRIIVFMMSFYNHDAKNTFNHREVVGNDENVFDSIGYEIPCGTLMRHPFSEYHTDSDNIENTSKNSLEEVINFGLDVINIIENNFYFSMKKLGLPCLSNPDIDLYLSPDMVSGTINNSNQLINSYILKLPRHEQEYLKSNTSLLNQFMQNILRMANEKNTLLDVAEKSKIPFGFVSMYASLLQEKDIITLHEKEK